MSSKNPCSETLLNCEVFREARPLDESRLRGLNSRDGTNALIKSNVSRSGERAPWAERVFCMQEPRFGLWYCIVPWTPLGTTLEH